MSNAPAKKKRVQDPTEDRILYTCVAIILVLFGIIVLYPMIFVLSSSFSSGVANSTGRVVLWPVDFDLEGYKTVFSYKSVIPAYMNTIFYTVVGTVVNIVVTMTCAYPLSRKDFPMRKFFMGMFLVTMFFSGGLIPTYMTISKLHLINSRWVLIIPTAMSVYNMILARTFLSNSIPKELLEASQIDGCSDAGYFFKIVLPLSKPVIAVITLYYAVGHWNSYFNAMMYLSNRDLYPLQLVLRDILVANQVNLNEMVDVEQMIAKQGLADTLKYALIVVATVPILCIYPFIQKYFVQGVMIGAVKG